MEKPKFSSKSGVRRIVLSRWFWVTMVALAFIGLVLTLLPYGIDYGAERWLMSHGADLATVDDIDFNPFTGTLVVHDLQVEVGDARVMHIKEAMLNVDWLPFWRRKAHVEKLTISDASVTVQHENEKGWRVGGLAFAAARAVSAEPTESPWGFRLARLEVNNSQIHHVGHGLQVTLQIDRALMNRMTSWETEQAAHLDFHGRVNDSKLRVEADFLPFAEKPSVKGSIELSALSLKDFAELTAAHLTSLDGLLHVKGRLEASKGGETGLELVQQGTIMLRDVNVKNESVNLTGEQLKWAGTIRLSLPDAGKNSQINGQGQFESGRLAAGLASAKMNFQSNGLVWEGKFDSGKNGVIKDAAITGNLRVNGLEIDDLARNLSLLRLQRLDLKSFSANGTRQFSAPKVQLEQLRLVQHAGSRQEKGGDHSLFKVALITLNEFDLKEPQELKIKSVELQEVTSFIRRDPKGRWELIADMLANRDSKQSADKAGTGRSMTVRISRVGLGGDSRIRFEDESVSPPFRTTLQFGETYLADLNTSRSEQPTGLVVNAKVGEYSQVSLQGQLKTLAQESTSDLTGRIEDFDLPPLSSYSAQQIGYKVRSGLMDADIKIQAVQRNLKGNITLIISNLEVAPTDAERIKQFETMLRVPLPTALAVLRDNNKNIKLEVPITGDIGDPKFNFSDALEQALIKGIKKAGVSYLKYILQPYGTVITVVELGVMAGKKLTAVRLDPVVFAPGDAKLSDTTFPYLQRVAELMKTRPELRIKLCGLAAPPDFKTLPGKDFETLQKQPEQVGPVEKEKNGIKAEKPMELDTQPISDERLQELVRQRALAIKEHLVQQHGIAPDRLFICHPELDRDKDGKPRVELLI